MHSSTDLVRIVKLASTCTIIDALRAGKCKYCSLWVFKAEYQFFTQWILVLLGAANARSLLSPVHSDRQCRSLSNSSATKSLDGVGGGWGALHGFEDGGSWKIKVVGRQDEVLHYSPFPLFQLRSGRLFQLRSGRVIYGRSYRIV